MEDIEFRSLTEDDEQVYRAFVNEFFGAGEKMIPSSVYWEGLTYLEWLEKTRNISKGVDLPEGWVPSTLYFLFRKSDGKMLGAIDLRHALSDRLLKFGGNIGYGVVPSERRKGYASMMLQLALGICKEMGMDKVLITCNKENIGSAKTIRKNGGILENEMVDELGRTRCRYWINLSND